MTEQSEKVPFWEEMGLPAPGARLTLEEYNALPEVNFHMEWWKGVVVYPNWNEDTMTAAPNIRHLYIVMDVIDLLKPLVPSGRVLTAPGDIWLDGIKVQPDVFWIAEESNCYPHASGNFFEGPPELIVEVTSPSNAANDRVRKFDLYERSGVGEYWIVDTSDDFVEVYSLEAGTYRRVGAFQAGQTFDSPVLGKTVNTSPMFES